MDVLILHLCEGYTSAIYVDGKLIYAGEPLGRTSC